MKRQAALWAVIGMGSLVAGCGGKSAAGGSAGGGGSIDGGGDAGGSIGTATFTGGFSGSASCAVSLTQPASGSWVIASAGSAVAGTPYGWSGFHMANDGPATPGVYDQTNSTGTSTGATNLTTGTPSWSAAFGQGAGSGSFDLSLSSLGAGSELAGGGTLYAQPHGRIDATLVDGSATPQPDVMLSIVF